MRLIRHSRKRLTGEPNIYPPIFEVNLQVHSNVTKIPREIYTIVNTLKKEKKTPENHDEDKNYSSSNEAHCDDCKPVRKGLTHDYLDAVKTMP